MKYLTIKIVCNEHIHQNFKNGTGDSSFLLESFKNVVKKFFIEYPNLPENNQAIFPSK